MTRNTISWIAALAIVALLTPLAQALPTYTGSLASDYDTGNTMSADGLIEGSGGWVTNDDGPLVLSWTVSPATIGTSTYWKYEYVFNTLELQGGISHWIIEVSDNMSASEIVQPSAAFEAGDPSTYGPGDQENDYIPDDVYAIKFDTTDGEGPYTLTFYTQRNPVWGDFYAKDGNKGGDAWNAGFTNPDSDPDDAPRDGSVESHILRPDTTFTIPAPGAILLSSIGTVLIGWGRRRRQFLL